jgi:predicted SnoaL-like aldol condensation-catalyzing enzyme
MKKIIFLSVLGLICLIYSCNQPASSGGASGSGTDTAYVNKIKAINDAVYTAFETGDVSKLDSSFALPNLVDHGMGMKDVVGRDTIKAMFAKVHSQFNNLKLQVVSESVDSNYSMAWVHMTGTPTSAESGFPVGVPIDMMSVDVVRWENGKAAEHWGYMDPRDMMKMMPPSSSMPKAMSMPMDSAMHK